jgi:hypothetical protein
MEAQVGYGWLRQWFVYGRNNYGKQLFISEKFGFGGEGFLTKM